MTSPQTPAGYRRLYSIDPLPLSKGERETALIVLGLYSDEDALPTMEFSLTWIDLGHNPALPRASTPRLTMFDDSWPAIPHLQDLFDGLATFAAANRNPMTPKEAEALLLSIGFENTVPERTHQ